MEISLEAKAVAAFLGASVGDALGWPNEDRVRHAGGKPKADRSKSQFIGWIKRSGGRFMPYEEEIRPGEYSDDTQLILAIARSLLTTERWWQDFAFVELPFWSAYERGGGGATKRAANSLLTGQLPWTADSKYARTYFEAGGNGVAMRALPHVVHKLREVDFSKTRWSVIVDGVCTHGHPRALVGALVFAYALRAAFLHTGTLGYGALIEETLNGAKEWGSLPSFGEAWPDWIQSADRISRGSYQDMWDKTVHEMTRLLDISVQGMSHGALAVDRQVLEQLGCFDKRQSGSGTVGAAASIFLASRHAAAPMNGAMAASLATGADTDTIASMTCSLLSAVVGPDWVLPIARQVQDEAYLQSVASRLFTSDIRSDRARKAIRKSNVEEFFDRLDRGGKAGVTMPDGRNAVTIEPGSIASKSESVVARCWRVTVQDGQTLYCKRISKRSRQSGPLEEELPLVSPDEPTAPSLGVAKIGTQLLVRDLQKSKRFYERILGLPIYRETATTVNFGGVLALRAASGDRPLSGAMQASIPVALFIEVQNISSAHSHMLQLGGGSVDAIRTIQGRQAFSCLDPDGYVIEFYEGSGSHVA